MTRVAAAEAERQRSLLAAVAGVSACDPVPSLRERGQRAARGLAAYRANAGAIAERALAAALPTVRALVGDADFAHLARACWRADPPERGDLGEWGDAVPAWLQAHAGLAAWPYLADCARLDLALHRCERAADATFDAASLQALESADPAVLVLELMPGTVMLRSSWPIAAIHAAHRRDDNNEAGAGGDESAFAAARAAIAERRGDAVLIARQGWRAKVHRLADTDLCWTESLLAGASLDDALTAADARFDFASWLATALRESWLKGVRKLPE
jgi:hypothetical protein